MALSKEEIALIVSEVVQQVNTQSSDQVAKQIEQSVSQAVQKIQGSTQEKSSVTDGVTQNKQEETNTGEAHRGKTFTDAEMWGLNKKALIEKSFDYDRAMKALEVKNAQLEVVEREAKLRKQSTLDAIEVSEREQASLMKHAFNTLSLDFRTAAMDPFSPNAANPDERDA